MGRYDHIQDFACRISDLVWGGDLGWDRPNGLTELAEAVKAKIARVAELEDEVERAKVKNVWLPDPDLRVREYQRRAEAAEATSAALALDNERLRKELGRFDEQIKTAEFDPSDPDDVVLITVSKPQAIDVQRALSHPAPDASKLRAVIDTAKDIQHLAKINDGSKRLLQFRSVNRLLRALADYLEDKPSAARPAPSAPAAEIGHIADAALKRSSKKVDDTSAAGRVLKAATHFMAMQRDPEKSAYIKENGRYGKSPWAEFVDAVADMLRDKP